MNAILESGTSDGLRIEFEACRRDTHELLEGLSDADVATVAGSSTMPLRRLAHASAHLEHDVLGRFLRRAQPADAAARLAAAGSIAALLAHRDSVDSRMRELLSAPVGLIAEAVITRALALEREQQELFLVDLLELFARRRAGTLHPLCRHARGTTIALARASHAPWVEYPGGRAAIGRDDDWFAPECEQPRHEVRLTPFGLAAVPVSNRDWCEFVDDGGYARASLWSPEGWRLARARNWQAPLYWRGGLERPTQITLAGELPLEMEAPVCHISAFEAQAYASWARKLLPSEAQWEAAAARQQVAGNFVGSARLRTVAARTDAQAPLRQLFGDVWEWTSSAFAPYPVSSKCGSATLLEPARGAEPSRGTVPADGSSPARAIGLASPMAGRAGPALGALSGGRAEPSPERPDSEPFALGVLRGGSCATPIAAVHASTRRGLAPRERRHFSGLRLAQERS